MKSNNREELIIINRHNFDKTLKKIDNFANSVPELKNLDKFSTDGGLFGWGDHYINGNEMNRHVEVLQDILKEHLEAVIETRKEFRDVYSTFDWLDKEYLQGIMGAVNAASIASKGAKAASDQAKEASHRANIAAQKALNNENDIKKDVENLRKVVEKIKGIKDQFNSDLSKIKDSLVNLQNDVDTIKTQVNSDIKDIEISINKIQIELKNIKNNYSTKEDLNLIKNNIIDIQKSLLKEPLENSSPSIPKDNSLNKKIVLAYIIGSLGLIGSIIAICL